MTNRAYFLRQIIAATEDCFAQMQRAAKLKDWKAFNRLLDDHRNLCAQWQALIS